MVRNSLALFIGASIATLFVAPSLRAENITFARGEVFVNHGSGFTPVTGHDELKIGDTIFAKPNGQAQVLFGDGCHFTVESGSALLIHGGPSPCAAGSNGNNDSIPNARSASGRVDFQDARAIGP